MRLDMVGAFTEAFTSCRPTAWPSAVAMYRSCVAVGMSHGVVFVLMPRLTDAGYVWWWSMCGGGVFGVVGYLGWWGMCGGSDDDGDAWVMMMECCDALR